MNRTRITTFVWLQLVAAVVVGLPASAETTFRHQDIYYRTLQDEPVDGAIPVELTKNQGANFYYTFPENSYISLPGTFSEGGVNYRLERIGFNALNNIKVDYIEIPKTVKSIDDYAFYSANIKCELILPDEISEDNVGKYFLDLAIVGKFVVPSNWKKLKYVSRMGGFRELILPDGLETICTNAFTGFSSITYLHCGKGLRTVEPGAFHYTTVTSFYMHGAVPPEPGNFMDNVHPSDIPRVYVAPESYDAYMAAPVWNTCYVIAWKELSSGVAMENDGCGVSIAGGKGCISVGGNAGHLPLQVFDLSGKAVYEGSGESVENLQPGIYVVRCGAKVAKVAVR